MARAPICTCGETLDAVDPRCGVHFPSRNERLYTKDEFNTAVLREIKQARGQARAEVLAACISATCVLCRNGKEPYLQSFGGKNWEGKHQAWVHDVHVESRTVVEPCLADAIRSLQPAASHLEHYGESKRLDGIRDGWELAIAHLAAVLNSGDSPAEHRPPDMHRMPELWSQLCTALEELLREAELRGLKLSPCTSLHDIHNWPCKRCSRIAELEKAHAEGKE